MQVYTDVAGCLAGEHGRASDLTTCLPSRIVEPYSSPPSGHPCPHWRGFLWPPVVGGDWAALPAGCIVALCISRRVRATPVLHAFVTGTPVAGRSAIPVEVSDGSIPKMWVIGHRRVPW